MLWARSTIFTGSPMSRTNTSPLPAPMSPARITSCTASGIVMKKRVISGCVTVTGPPRSFWLRKMGPRLRPAALDLAAEDRHPAAGGGEDVAEADRGEARLRVPLSGGLDDPLGH